MSAAEQPALAATPRELLLVAERLFSERGVDGVSTREIARVLGYANGDEVIHRDDLVLIGG